MRKTLLAAVGAGALAVGAPAATALGVAEPASKPKPRLVLVDETPLTLRGTNFVRGERVRVLVRLDGTAKQRRVAANPRGAFLAVFRDVTAAHRCSLLSAEAVGNAGSRAVLKLMPQPMCPPPLQP